MTRIATLAVRITRFVDDYPPGFVECSLLDAQGRLHLFVEKAPVVSTENLWSDSVYPRDGTIDCEVQAEWVDEAGRRLVRVDTERPWVVESTDGLTQFVVLASQVDRRAASD